MEVYKGKLLKVDKVTQEQDFDFSYSDNDLLENEINEFYSPLESLDFSNLGHAMDSVEDGQVNFKKLLHYNLGIQGNFNKEKQLGWINKSTKEIMEIPRIYENISQNLNDQDCLGVLYNILLLIQITKEETDLDVLHLLKESFKTLEISHDYLMISKRLLVTLKLLQVFTGGEEGLKNVKEEKRDKYGLSKERGHGAQKVGVLEYRHYQNELIKRYPGYVLEDSEELTGVVEEYPACLRRSIEENPDYLHPFTEKEYLPKGMQEIKEILQKNMYISAGTIEKLRPQRFQQGKIKEFGDLYKDMHPDLGKTVSTLLKILYSVILGSNIEFEIPSSELPLEERKDFLQDAIKERSKLVLCKSISGILLMLLKIFKVHHILEFEHFCAILVEQNCQLIFLKLLVSWFPSPATVLKMGQEKPANIKVGASWLMQRDIALPLDFFAYSQKKNLLTDFSNLVVDDQSPKNDSLCSEASTLLFEGRKTCFASFYSTINLIRILQKITKRKYCRLLHLIQLKTCNILKRIILINNRDLQYEALKLLKSQIPFLGKKWRMQNMSVISTMYRILPSQLLDDTLSVDFEIHPAESAKDENKLREMIRDYHSKFYAMENNAPAIPSSKNDLDLLLLLSRYSSIADIPETCDLKVPVELDSHFKENYKSWWQRELLLDYYEKIL